MTQDEIIEMAKEAGFWQDLSVYEGLGEHFKAFAKLVAAKERERLARFSQTLPNPYKHCQVSSHAYDMAILEYSRAILARGERA